MKIYLYAFLLIALLTNCEDGETIPSEISGKINQEFTLKPNQTIQLTGVVNEEKLTDVNAITVQLIEALDGRCPTSKDIQCFVAGSAKVTLKVSQGQSYNNTIYLCLGDCDYYLPNSPYKGNTVEFSVGANRFVAKLQSVESLEKGFNPKIVQRVVLVVESK
jgi:hypothetical protein